MILVQQECYNYFNKFINLKTFDAPTNVLWIKSQSRVIQAMQ